MERVIRPIKLDDVVFLVGQQRRVWLASAEAGQWPPPLPAPGVSANSSAVLTPRGVDAAQLRLMALQVPLCLDAMHPVPAPLRHARGCARHGGCRGHPLDLVAAALAAVRGGIALGRLEGDVDAVVNHWVCLDVFWLLVSRGVGRVVNGVMNPISTSTAHSQAGRRNQDQDDICK